MSKYRTTWLDIQEQMNESALSHTVRYRDPLNKKRFAVPFKTAEKAKEKMDQLKRDGVKEIEITKDILRGKFKEVVEGTIAEDGHTAVPSSKRMAQVISEDAQLIIKELNKKSDEDELPTWWTNKLAVSAHNMNAARDYITDNIKEDLDEQSPAQRATEMLKNLATAAGYKRPSSGDGYQAVWDYRNGKGKFQGKGKKTFKQVQDWIYKNGYRIDMGYLKDILGEEVDLEEAMSDAQLKKVRDSYKDLKTISPEKVKTLKNFLDRYSTDSLMQLAQANINFVSTMARSVMNKRKMGDPKHAGSMKEDAAQDMERVAKLRIQQMKIQTKVQKMDRADPKNKTPLAIAKNDLDNLQMRMDQLKDRAQKTKNEEVHPAKALIEAIEAVKNKAEKTGMPYSILKQVYDRGMAAWKGGHRPGTTPQQWALARVNSFVTKSSGTWGGADSDLAKKVRSKK